MAERISHRLGQSRRHLGSWRSDPVKQKSSRVSWAIITLPSGPVRSMRKFGFGLFRRRRPFRNRGSRRWLQFHRQRKPSEAAGSPARLALPFVPRSLAPALCAA